MPKATTFAQLIDEYYNDFIKSLIKENLLYGNNIANEINAHISQPIEKCIRPICDCGAAQVKDAGHAYWCSTKNSLTPPT